LNLNKSKPELKLLYNVSMVSNNKNHSMSSNKNMSMVSNIIPSKNDKIGFQNFDNFDLNKESNEIKTKNTMILRPKTTKSSSLKELINLNTTNDKIKCLIVNNRKIDKLNKNNPSYCPSSVSKK